MPRKTFRCIKAKLTERRSTSDYSHRLSSVVILFTALGGKQNNVIQRDFIADAGKPVVAHHARKARRKLFTRINNAPAMLV
jgi:hypothetical protein